MIRLLTASPRAILTASHVTAFGAVKPLRVAGIRVLRDLSLVGFDNVPTYPFADWSMNARAD
jgi:DNA-binding LacI/PurR family transcriptional regulator